MSKSYNGRITKWVWDGNVILHEWVEQFEDVNDEEEIPDNLQSEEAVAAFLQAQLEGRPSKSPPESGEIPLPTTWLFDPDTFVPASKIVGDKHFSIITDHLGTPLSMFDDAGVQTWGAELDIFGSVKNLQGESNNVPFRYPGQYEDGEIGLYYNRFRYYDAEIGEYVSQDPISLEGALNVYQYVSNPNAYTDIFGLSGCKTAKAKRASKTHVFWSGGDFAKNSAIKWARKNGGVTLEMTGKGSWMQRKLGNLDWLEAAPAWDKASKHFAKNAKGTVHVFMTKKAMVNPNSVWHRIEKPILTDAHKNITYHIID